MQNKMCAMSRQIDQLKGKGKGAGGEKHTPQSGGDKVIKGGKFMKQLKSSKKLCQAYQLGKCGAVGSTCKDGVSLHWCNVNIGKCCGAYGRFGKDCTRSSEGGKAAKAKGGKGKKGNK